MMSIEQGATSIVEAPDSHVSRLGVRFAGALIILALIAGATGLVLLPYYWATAAGAHASVLAMDTSLPLAAIRAAHHWTSALLLLGGGGYLFFGLWSGAYRRIPHAAWAASVLLACVFLLCQLTGHLLPWDSAAVRTAAIETGIAENIPVIGHTQARLVRGGDVVGPHTLSIWYAGHVLLLPMTIAGLTYLAFGRGLKQERKLIPSRTAAPVFAVVLVAAVLMPARLGPPASPIDYQSYDALPEWYVLPLHSLLVIAQRLSPNLAFIGTAVVPGLAITGLVSLPWGSHRARSHPPQLLVRAATVTGAAAIGFLSLLSGKDMAPLVGSAGISTARAETFPLQSASMIDPASAAKGKAVFTKQGCLSCHTVARKGGTIAPPLDDERKRHPSVDWQIRHLIAPSSVVRSSTMPAYGSLTDAERRAIAAYLLTL